MLLNQQKFFEALDSAIYAYKNLYQRDYKSLTATEAEGYRAEINLLKKVRDFLLPMKAEEIFIDEKPF